MDIVSRIVEDQCNGKDVEHDDLAKEKCISDQVDDGQKVEPEEHGGSVCKHGDSAEVVENNPNTGGEELDDRDVYEQALAILQNPSIVGRAGRDKHVKLVFAELFREVRQVSADYENSSEEPRSTEKVSCEGL